MKGGASPRTRSGGFNVASGKNVGTSSGKFKVYELKKEKKRPLLLLSDSESDMDLHHPQRKGNGPADAKRKRGDMLKTELDFDAKRKIGSPASDRKRSNEAGPVGTRIREDSCKFTANGKGKVKVGDSKFSAKNVRLSGTIRNRDEDEIDIYSTVEEGTEPRRGRSGFSKFSRTDEFNRKQLEIEYWKSKEDSGEVKGNRASTPKSPIRITRQRENKAEYIRNNVEKIRVPKLRANGNSTDDGTRKTNRVFGSGFKLERDESVPFRGAQRESLDGFYKKGIRVQGKGGVLKVMPNSRIKLDGFEKTYSRRDVEENRKGTMFASTSYQHGAKKVNDSFDSSARISKYPVRTYLPNGKNKVCFMDTEENESSSGQELGSTDSSNVKIEVKSRGQSSSALVESLPSKKGKQPKNVCVTGAPKKQVQRGRNLNGKANSSHILPNNHMKKSMLNGKSKSHSLEAEDDSSSETELRNNDPGSIKREVKCKGESSSAQSAMAGSVQKKKASGPRKARQTEKQSLRNHIKNMLVGEGWAIDMRPRKSRTYNDYVYISPSGTEYWSILNAYHALERQFSGQCNIKNKEHNGVSSSFSPIPVEVLSMLTRKTKKQKIREEMAKKKLVDGKGSKNANQGTKKTIRKEKMAASVVYEDKLQKVKLKGKASSRKLKSDHLSEEAEYMNRDYGASDEGNSMKIIPKGTGKSVRAKKLSSTSDDYLLHERKNGKQRGNTLLVRSSNKANLAGVDSSQNPRKLTILSWLIDAGTVPENGKVQYMSKKRTRALLDGWITRDGIHCSCCSKILTVSKFEIHAGSKLRQPFQNIFVENGTSLFQCQLDAWNLQEEYDRQGFHFIEMDGDDPNDDTCGICGDGGDLICCDSCPSTFHQGCLNVKMLPAGDWHCPNCSCRFCGVADIVIPLVSCSQCERKYHQECTEETDVSRSDSNNLCISFCGKSCRKVFERLQKLLGVRNDLDAGFSWTIVHRFDDESERSPCTGPQRAEWNSKLAVALTVMDECFLPIVDRRSGINLIHNVLYNCGSNFNRLNYSGFYTVILERGDEVICAASIRIHGTSLAEMPFIGTRHMYRRQGMCRRLLNAIELALCSLNVENLIIPAISELIHTWTTVFGFKPLEESYRQDMRSMNILVFPGVDMLQKSLVKHGISKGNKTADAVELVKNQHGGAQVARPSTGASSVEIDVHISEASSIVHDTSEGQYGDPAVETGFNVSGGSIDGTSAQMNKPLDAHLIEVEASVGPYADTAEITSQSHVAASGYNCQGSGESTMHHNPVSIYQSMEPTSEYNRETVGESPVRSESEFGFTASAAAFSVSADNAHQIELEADTFLASSPFEQNPSSSMGPSTFQMKDGDSAVETDLLVSDGGIYNSSEVMDQSLVTSHGPKVQTLDADVVQGSIESIMHHNSVSTKPTLESKYHVRDERLVQNDSELVLKVPESACGAISDKSH